LIIDESHSLGIVGVNGCGLYSTINHSNIKRKILFASLGKAFGLSGGVIASDDEFMNQIATNDTFVSSAGMNPAFVQTMADAEEIYIRQHKKLRKKLDYIHANLVKNKNTPFNPEYPVIYPEIEGINEVFSKNKIIVTNFKYPTDTKMLNRIVITANHKEKDLDKLIHILNQHQF
jgi:7-keto-8-aminopelargonate synthetase-like enzyme